MAIFDEGEDTDDVLVPRITQCVVAESLTVPQWQLLRPGDELQVLNVKSGIKVLEVGKPVRFRSKHLDTPSGECMVRVDNIESGYYAGRFGLPVPLVTPGPTFAEQILTLLEG